ncbi:TIGR02302 family protein [Ancylobacter mangrovi]|uniref:TIGR02302 family protein n=1 Tax=Ancylobacter mangrovi TaxID=2972472 RepID=UPI002162B794|nr:TIGR02302 family protein [Ancylobacter mangrovi]MCS0502623.1 TIGR02302 family protein [Ancylobacter mangrovi]
MTAAPEGQSETGGDMRAEDWVRAAIRRAEKRMDAAQQRAYAAILWERSWPAIAAVAAALGVFLIASWLGLWVALTPLWRMALLVPFALLVLAALIPAFRIRPPSAAETLARLDRTSRLPHRPVTALADHLATRPDDPVGAALWRAHVTRASNQLGSLRAGLPSPRLAAIDGRAVRALVLLGVVATFFMAPGDHLRRISAAFDWQTPVPPVPYRIDAWVTPPGYTARPPVMLPGLRSLDVAQNANAANAASAAEAPSDPSTPSYDAAALTVPAGSELVVRVTGPITAQPSVEGGIAPAEEAKAEEKTDGKTGEEKAADATGKDANAATAAATAASSATSSSGSGRTAANEHHYLIKADGSARITGPDGRVVAWHFRAVPDEPPSIELTREPQASGRTGLILAYKAEDDYGVAAAEATFAAVPPAPPLHALSNAPAKPAARVLVDPPNFPLPLSGGRGKVATGQTTRDLTESPWAGTRVTMTLTARDQAGNVGMSRPRRFVLPERLFTNPLARALIDERSRLALDANQRERVEAALDGLAIAPDRFTPDASQYMGLRTAYWRLVNAKTDDDLRGVVDYLWEVAIRIEDGDLSDVEKRLRDAQQALQNALENNASDDDIKRLTDELRQAMQKFMQELAKEAMRNRDQADSSQPMDPNTRFVRPQDLQKMLDRIEQMARNGARDAARQMLSELQNMLNGLQAGRQQQRRGQSQMSQAMDQLGDMIRRQQQLRDRTFKQGQQGQQGENGQQGQQGQQGEQGQNGQQFGDLRQSQEQLREQLRQLREKMEQAMRGRQPGQQGEGQQREQGQQGQQGQNGQGGMPGESGLGQAEQAMREAEEALGQGDGTGAVDAQSEALQALRRGAQQMAEAMQQQEGGPGGQPGGPSGEMAERNDPLGRPLRSRDYGDDVTVKVPDEMDMQRARQVLEELRRRFSDPSRPRLELDYLERLLHDF